jgi:hypothetical protein
MRPLEAVIRTGDAVDALAGALRAAPRDVARTVAVRRYRRIAAASGLAYLIVYLVAIQDIGISLGGQYGRFADPPSLEVVPDWSDRLLAARAPFLFEPVATVFVIPQLAVLVSPGNLLVGSTLGALLGLNVAVALHASARGRACRRGGYAGALGALPGLLLGFSCCAPTLILLLGTSFAAAVLPAFIPLRSYLFPTSVALMTALLARMALRTRNDAL